MSLVDFCIKTAHFEHEITNITNTLIIPSYNSIIKISFGTFTGINSFIFTPKEKYDGYNLHQYIKELRSGHDKKLDMRENDPKLIEQKILQK